MCTSEHIQKIFIILSFLWHSVPSPKLTTSIINSTSSSLPCPANLGPEDIDHTVHFILYVFQIHPFWGNGSSIPLSFHSNIKLVKNVWRCTCYIADCFWDVCTGQEILPGAINITERRSENSTGLIQNQVQGALLTCTRCWLVQTAQPTNDGREGFIGTRVF